MKSNLYKDIKGDPFCIEDQFFFSHEDYIQHLINYDGIKLKDVTDDWTRECYSTKKERVVNITEKVLIDWIESENEERFSENGWDDEVNKIRKALEASIDFEKLNSLIPELWYGDSKYIITKDDVYEDLKKEIED